MFKLAHAGNRLCVRGTPFGAYMTSRSHRPVFKHIRQIPVGMGVVCCLFAPACRKNTPPRPPVIPSVTTAHPVKHEVFEWDEYTGHLEAVETVDLRARVSGLIVAAAFEEGSMIRKGDLLIEIDARPFQAELDTKLADEAKATADVNLAQIEMKRMASVPPDARSSIEYDTSAASLKRAEALLAGAKAAVEASRLNVEWCRVLAPIDGRIGRKFVTPGNLVSGGSGAGTLLTRINSVDPIYCYIDVDEQSVLKYQRLAREGKRVSARDARIPCFLQLSHDNRPPIEGVIDFVDNRMDSGTGTIRGRGVFPNADGRLTPGFFGRVKIPGSGRYDAVLVPDSAVVTDQNQKVLLVVGADDKVETRPVQLGSLLGTLRVIESGISTTDRVVINGLLQAQPGSKVAPRDSNIPPSALEKAAFGLETFSRAASQPAPTTQPEAAAEARP